MDFQFDEKAEKLREEIRQFVKENIPPGHVPGFEEHSDDDWEFSMSISAKLAEKGWLTMSWPKAYGGLEASEWERMVYGEEIGYWSIPGTTMGVGGVSWVGPSLMLFGSEALKKKHLPLIASGRPDGVWCTGYSEPDAGTDFANIRTRAERQGDEYIINGQKVWTSAAHRARWCWLAVKTDPEAAKKHHGISIIIVDMKSEGITVRPLVNYCGFHRFNEVFFSDVRVPAGNLVGEENRGWYQLMQSLGFERGGVIILAYGEGKRILDELVQYTRDSGLINNPRTRHKLADMAVDLETLKVLAWETVWNMSKGTPVIYEPSRDKAFRDMLFDKFFRYGTEILGAYSQIDPLAEDSKWARLRGRVERPYWGNVGFSIAAGTTDNQRNIIGQFGLQLPKSY
jgi:alkylation response protein AidB-like acyl-CoA dehydrogenase